jgi:hypothetical protein
MSVFEKRLFNYDTCRFAVIGGFIRLHCRLKAVHFATVSSGTVAVTVTVWQEFGQLTAFRIEVL